MNISGLANRYWRRRPSPAIHPKPCSRGLQPQMELITIQANVLLVYVQTSALKQMCTADLGNMSQGTGHRCTCSLLSMKGQPNSERDATFLCRCVSEPVEKPNVCEGGTRAMMEHLNSEYAEKISINVSYLEN